MTTVDLTPNFSILRHRFERDAASMAANAVLFIQRGASVPPETVRNLMAYLNIAISAIDSTEALIEFREEFDKIASQIIAADDKANSRA